MYFKILNKIYHIFIKKTFIFKYTRLVINLSHFFFFNLYPMHSFSVSNTIGSDQYFSNCNLIISRIFQTDFFFHVWNNVCWQRNFQIVSYSRLLQINSSSIVFMYIPPRSEKIVWKIKICICRTTDLRLFPIHVRIDK